VDSCTEYYTETKYFHTLTKREGNILTIAGHDAMTVGAGCVPIILPMGTQITVEKALLYPDSTCTLQISGKTGFMLKHTKRIKKNIFFLLKTLDMANKLLKKFLLFYIDCTIHKSNP
jgi:hypothetical protein